LAGEEKQRESLRSLLRAGSILRQRYGTVYVSFAEPISLSEALGSHKERFLTHGNDAAVEQEKRYFIQKLGFRLLREVNAVAVAGATAVSATALLAASRPAVRVSEFLRTTSVLAELLRFQGVRFTASLERNVAGRFQESMVWLGSQGLVQRLSDAGAEVLYVPADKRTNVDFYKNNIIHFFLLPALVARALRNGVPIAKLREEVWWWLDLYRWEFALTERNAFGAELQRFLDYLHTVGALRDGIADPAHPVLAATAGILENFREAYRITARTLASERAWPLVQKAVLARLRRAFYVAQLLGDVSKPEANSAVTYTCALNRYAELGYIAFTTDERAGKDRRLTPGPAYDQLPALVERLG
jgi:glycerol-3-phosphate O-acyltransferase